MPGGDETTEPPFGNQRAEAITSVTRPTGSPQGRARPPLPPAHATPPPAPAGRLGLLPKKWRRSFPPSRPDLEFTVMAGRPGRPALVPRVDPAIATGGDRGQ